jgi:dTDP-glucose 4,6-dehydratase
VRFLVTGGAGFIGSAFVRRALARDDLEQLTVLDKLTYAGDPTNLEAAARDPRYRFVQGDINDKSTVAPLVVGADIIVNFAAESHVDRSIEAADNFVRTNVHGVLTLLDAARTADVTRFVQISTDEVYGEVTEGRSTESDPLNPRSPYAATKAAGDLLALSYHATYGLPVVVTRGSNTYGPRQFPEKLIPLFITNAIDHLPLPLYGDGRQERDWLFVDDHCAAIEAVIAAGTPGTVYNAGGGASITNAELTRHLLALLDRPASLVRHVSDRPGHDRRYALDSSRLETLGWAARTELLEGLERTVSWYRENEAWWRRARGGAFGSFYDRLYAGRLADARDAS